MKFNKEEIYIFIKQNIKTIVASFLASIAIITCFFIFYYKNEDDTDSNFQNYNVSTENINISSETTGNKAIFIDIKGQVKNPGLYEMSKEDRVNDAIEKAGGLLADADTSNVNLSQKLKDQMLIIVDKKGEKRASVQESIRGSNKSNPSKSININLATKEELMQISGVGETRAQAIIDYRENKGDFNKIEDIMKVKGIGKSSFEKIKDQIEV